MTLQSRVGATYLLLAVLAFSGAGCRDIQPRIRTSGHILGGRDRSRVGFSDVENGRLVATDAYLGPLQSEVGRLGVANLSLSGASGFSPRGNSVLVRYTGAPRRREMLGVGH